MALCRAVCEVSVSPLRLMLIPERHGSTANQEGRFGGRWLGPRVPY